jgi:hypothetical protein
MDKKIKNINKYYPYIIIFIVINAAYFILDIGVNDKFKTLISFYGSLSIFISMYSLYMSINNNKLNRISSDIVYINKIFSDIDNDIYVFFKNNTSMKYYYNELYNSVSDYTEENRNIQLEKLISYKILSNAETLINYIDVFKTANGMSSELNIAEIKLKNLLNLFLKSKIFVQNWKEYSQKIAMSWTKDYFDLYFEYY